MFKLTLISALAVALFVGPAAAQTPDRKPDVEAPAARALAFSFEGSGSYLGVQTSEITRDNFAKAGLRDVRGVAVEKVMENSPAAAAGLRAGDVIVKFNGEAITSGRKLSRLVNEVTPDHQVRLTVVRNGTEQELTATVGKSPAPTFDNGNFTITVPPGKGEFDLGKLRDLPEFRNPPDLRGLQRGDDSQIFSMPEGDSFVWRSGSGRQIGVSVYPVTKQLGERYGVEGGLLINTVREDTAAAKAGLKAGDIIVEADGKAINTELDLIRSVNEKKDGPVTLTIMRERNRQTITVTPEPAKGGGFLFQTEGSNGVKPLIDKIQITRPMAPAPIPFGSLFRDWVI